MTLANVDAIAVGKNKPRFVVTGFGPFHGVTDNPTTVLAKGLVEYLQSTQEQPTISLASRTETLVLETSAEDVRQKIDGIFDRICQQERDDLTESASNQEPPPPPVILVHLGVNSGTDKFELEKYAYNEASFRVPDQLGYQPQATPIFPNAEFGRMFETSIDVEAIQRELTRLQSVSSNAVMLCEPRISTDPGRYVCNYVYCYSLNKFQCHVNCQDGDTSLPDSTAEETGLAPMSQPNRYKCLFVHVPPFQIIPVEQQFFFVAKLLEVVDQQVTITT